jgi:hypothetical protein
MMDAKKRARPWESRQQRRSAEIHRENRERIARERSAMEMRWRKPEVAVPWFKIKYAAGEGHVPVVETKERECLRCERTFKSVGSGNRLCTSCRRMTEGIIETGVSGFR